MGSFNCNFKAYDFMINTNFFNGADYFSITAGQPDYKFPGFTDWYKCVNESARVTQVLMAARQLWSNPSINSAARSCMDHYSLDIFQCEHWTEEHFDCNRSHFVALALAALAGLLLI
jgi:hypothetical protein